MKAVDAKDKSSEGRGGGRKLISFVAQPELAMYEAFMPLGELTPMVVLSK
jgi:hypothetical protein